MKRKIINEKEMFYLRDEINNRISISLNMGLNVAILFGSYIFSAKEIGNDYILNLIVYTGFILLLLCFAIKNCENNRQIIKISCFLKHYGHSNNLWEDFVEFKNDKYSLHNDPVIYLLNNKEYVILFLISTFIFLKNNYKNFSIINWTIFFIIFLIILFVILNLTDLQFNYKKIKKYYNDILKEFKRKK